FHTYNSPTTSLHLPSLHDALPILVAQPLRTPARTPASPLHRRAPPNGSRRDGSERTGDLHRLEHLELVAFLEVREVLQRHAALEDRKSTRLNSSHVKTSYAVFCLK